MLNTERIRRMTRLSAYEEHEGRETLPVCAYFKNDYVSKNMIWTAITTTLAYLLMMLLWFVYKINFYLEHLAQMNLIHLAVRLIIFYLALLVLSEVLAYFVFEYKYRKAQKLQKPYREGLKELERLYEEEDKAKQGYTTTIGGVADDDIS